MRQYYIDGEKESPLDIFVFGSNLSGIHGAGSARYARLYKGAIYGQGTGPQGSSYALPTKDRQIMTLSLEEIQKYINVFIEFAVAFPHKTFYVTKVGCGLAGYRSEQIAPMFKDAPSNCKFHVDWSVFL